MKMLSQLFVVCSLVFAGGFAQADHSMQDVLDWTANEKGNNLFHAIHNLKKAKSIDTVCDFKNSIQMPVPMAADTTNTWRQIVLCFENEAAMEKAHEWLKEQPLQSYGVASTYGLRVSGVMDVTYDKSAGNNSIELIAISFK